MITRFEVQNFKALRDVSITLSPLHVLIGPNGSDKTSVLDAISGLARSTSSPLSRAFNLAPNDVSVAWQKDRHVDIRFTVHIEDAGNSLEYGLVVKLKESLINEDEWAAEAPTFEKQLLGNAGSNVSAVYQAAHSKTSQPLARLAPVIAKALDGVQCYRWNPRLLAVPAAPDSSRRFRMHESGFGLVLCLDDILGFDRPRFDALESMFRSVFPEVQSIRLVSEAGFRMRQMSTIPMFDAAEGKGIHFAFTGGLQLPASQVSDGMLLVLAYLCLLHNPESPRILLIEEPENGVHPQRLQDVLKILKGLVASQQHTQLILTTHSPYVLDQFEPHEVTLCTKNNDGSIMTRLLSESDVIRKQRKVFTLGEIWTSVGDDEIADRISSEQEASP